MLKCYLCQKNFSKTITLRQIISLKKLSIDLICNQCREKRDWLTRCYDNLFEFEDYVFIDVFEQLARRHLEQFKKYKLMAVPPIYKNQYYHINWTGIILKRLQLSFEEYVPFQMHTDIFLVTFNGILEETTNQVVTLMEVLDGKMAL